MHRFHGPRSKLRLQFTTDRLIDQWVSLTEERNAILCPSAGSGVPGATIEWNPLPGMEKHISVIFLDLDGKYRVT